MGLIPVPKSRIYGFGGFHTQTHAHETQHDVEFIWWGSHIGHTTQLWDRLWQAIDMYNYTVIHASKSRNPSSVPRIHQQSFRLKKTRNFNTLLQKVRFFLI